MRKNKEKQAYHNLLRTQEGLDPYQSLPVHELPEVKRHARAEYKKRDPLLRRLGRGALDNAAGVALILTNPQMFGRSTEANDEAIKTGQGLVGKRAARRFAKTYNRPKEKAQHRKEAEAIAVADARERHPNIAMREAELRTKWKTEQAERNRRKTFTKAVSQSNYAIEGFQRSNAYSFAKGIPRRSPEGKPGTGFDGSYFELAKSTLSDAMTYRKEDGSIPLLGAGIERERFAGKEASGLSLQDIRQSETSYIEGASTALWQLGFVEFDNERQVAYGNGKFNPSVEWGDYGKTASLAFDPENELHQMLMPEDGNFSNPSIQVEMAHDPHDARRQSHLDLRVVEAAVPASAIA